MKLSLQQSEIEAAILADISAQGIATQGKQVTFDFTMGRKGTGLTVEVDIASTTVTAKPPFTADTIVTAIEAPEETNPGYSTSAPTAGSLFGNP